MMLHVGLDLDPGLLIHSHYGLELKITHLCRTSVLKLSFCSPLGGTWSSWGHTSFSVTVFDRWRAPKSEQKLATDGRACGRKPCRQGVDWHRGVKWFLWAIRNVTDECLVHLVVSNSSRLLINLPTNCMSATVYAETLTHSTAFAKPITELDIHRTEAQWGDGATYHAVLPSGSVFSSVLVYMVTCRLPCKRNVVMLQDVWGKIKNLNEQKSGFSVSFMCCGLS